MNDMKKILICFLLLCGTALGDAFTDPRDGHRYKIVQIGKHTWMAEDLKFKVGGSWCYANNDANCRHHGRLYSWDAAINACPSDWRLPDATEWRNLIRSAGGPQAGVKLKSNVGWYKNKDGGEGNGTDDFGFSALPGGYRNTGGLFSGIGTSGDWWSSTEYDGNRAWNWTMYSSLDGVGENFYNKTNAYLVRCVRD
jgi:uncharacterized protein (TIGR02145 family)